MKAGCPVWQTVSCTLKAKVVVLNGHWKRANRKTWMDEQVSYRDVFLQPIHVETGNVWTDVWGTMWKKKHVKPKGGQCCQTLKETIFHFVQTTTNHCVSFGCKASGLNHGKCSSGGPKSSIVWFLLNNSRLYSLNEGIQSICSIEHYQLGHRNLISGKNNRPQACCTLTKM